MFKSFSIKLIPVVSKFLSIFFIISYFINEEICLLLLAIEVTLYIIKSFKVINLLVLLSLIIISINSLVIFILKSRLSMLVIFSKYII